LKSIASAPGKIILFGEHFVVHGTPAILAAIDKRVTVTSTFTENKTIKINSELGIEEVPFFIHDNHIAYKSTTPNFEEDSYAESREREYPKNLVKEVKSEFRPFVYLANKMINSNQNVNGLEITINSDIPVGVGLGSSSACCVAAAASIFGLSKELPYDSIKRLAHEAEETIFPDLSGADLHACTKGGMIEYEPTSRIIVFIGSDKSGPYGISANLVIVNSMIQHSTKRSVEKVRRFKENNEKRFSELCDLVTKLIGRLAKGSVRKVIENNDVAALGLKMTENQKYLEEIQVSNDTLRDMISSLKEISLGTKITGAGDGGCIIALVKDENLDKVPALLPKDKEYFSAKIDTKGVVWKTEE